MHNCHTSLHGILCFEQPMMCVYIAYPIIYSIREKYLSWCHLLDNVRQNGYNTDNIYHNILCIYDILYDINHGKRLSYGCPVISDRYIICAVDADLSGGCGLLCLCCVLCTEGSKRRPLIRKQEECFDVLLLCTAIRPRIATRRRSINRFATDRSALRAVRFRPQPRSRCAARL